MAAFTKSETPGENSEMALWHHKTTVTQTMAANPDTAIAAIPAESQAAAKYWRRRGAFLFPHRLCLPVTRTIAVRLPAPALGGTWTPCKPRHWGGKESLEKALCVYINSSVGIGAMLVNRSNKAPTYPRFSLNDLRGLRVPDFGILGELAEEKLAGAYDELARMCRCRCRRRKWTAAVCGERWLRRYVRCAEAGPRAGS